MTMAFEPRRAVHIDIVREMKTAGEALSADELIHFEKFDLIYRTLCALLFNFVPTSGHPGGSISAGRHMAALLFSAMDYDASDPIRNDADIISFGAGHKVLGLYAMWALRDEILRLGAPALRPADERHRVRLEDLLGFRRNPVTDTPLFVKHRAKALDGHPTPATPFVHLATGASGVGVTAALGLAFGAADYYADDTPRVHVLDGEGGLTPGRVGEAMAAAATASLANAVLHVDWNQASIDSDHVCRDAGGPGDYVQWSPAELAYLHDWNVVSVADGHDFQQVFAALRKAAALDNGQPTAIVYKTVKGWRYGIEGRKSHGAGHKPCSAGFLDAIGPFLDLVGAPIPRCEADDQRCGGGKDRVIVEECFWESLLLVRKALEQNPALVDFLAGRLTTARDRLDARARAPRENAPRIEAVYETARANAGTVPGELRLETGTKATLRGELGRVLNHYNTASGGAVLAASADLLGSTSVITAGAGFPGGYFNAGTNPGSRILSIGGICEDGMAGIFSGVATFGHHLGVGSSYGAFIAPLSHVAARLHAIGNQARQAVAEGPYNPMVVICGHAGVKTGEDGPTHADPQALQLFQDNFPRGTMVTLTPWDPQELWTVVTSALDHRPAVIAPFVTRPAENVLDRDALGLAPAADARWGVYRLCGAKDRSRGTVVLQGSEVAYAFVEETLPMLQDEDIDLDVFYVSSAELFDLLATEHQERLFPEWRAQEAMGITGFTLPTMYRWVRSERGRAATLHPFRHGHFLGSGPGPVVMAEAGIDGASQFAAIVDYLRDRG
jgi:transketolase